MDGPRVLDGLEFDDRLRWGDVVYDTAFFAMDLDRLGRLDLALAFLDRYWELSAETLPPSLDHHYIAYRALVPAEVSCLRGSAADDVEAHAYLALCHRHLLQGRVRLVVVGGLPGTGKSTLAEALGEVLGWPVLRSDEIRKEQAGLDIREHAPARVRARSLLAHRHRGDLRGPALPSAPARRARGRRHPRRVVLVQQVASACVGRGRRDLL